MRNIKKYVSLFVCLCMSTYTLPVFAMDASSLDRYYLKVELTDQVMNEIIGAGSIDAELTDYKVAGSKASAVITNRSIVQCSYSLETITSSGALVEVLTSGELITNTSMLISGVPTAGTNSNIVRVRLWNSGVPGLSAKDISWALE